MYIEPRVPRNPWMIKTGGDSAVIDENPSRRRNRLPRTRCRRYESPSAPPVTSWPIVLRRPSQRFGASSAQRTSHDDRRASALRDFGCSATSLTIVREALGDESRALLRV